MTFGYNHLLTARMRLIKGNLEFGKSPPHIGEVNGLRQIE